VEAETPDNEPARLAALRSYDILDTLPEPAYDDIARIAAQICGTPIALVSLVDEHRQWFKASVGIDAIETPRDLAFCAHAILEPRSLLVVEDATSDPRFAGNPLVTGPPGIRFYAGAPLVTSDGHALGTLCVIDRRPGSLTETQRRSLEALARQVVAQLELRRTVSSLEHSAHTLKKRNAQVERSFRELASLCRVLEDQVAMTERDLNRAEIIQRSLLPHHVPRLEGLSLHSLYRPGRNIGGDLFDVVVVDDRYLALVIADAAGHGVSAALISLLFKNRLRLSDDEGRPYRPCEVLALLNDAMQHDKPAPGVFVTALVCLYDRRDRVLLVASAGHPPLLRLGRDGRMEQVPHTGPALGLYAGADYGEQRLLLEEGDRVLLYTDGLLNAPVGDRMPTPQQVGEVLAELPVEGNTLGQLVERLVGATELEDRDDVSMLLLQIGPGENFLDEPVAPVSTVAATGAAVPSIRFAESADVAFLILAGRVSWMCGQTLLNAARAVLDGNRRLVIDLAGCEYLDSTVLGTLHELVTDAETRGAELQVQQVPQTLLDAFRELSMTAVLARISAEPLAIPERQRTVYVPEQSRRAHEQRLLRAHEVLAELSEANRDEFSPVIDALRGPD
jgi:serine phosphatase RsbU (regulator of sigma subunit)/anti-anti-sigma regulatory factor